MSSAEKKKSPRKLAEERNPDFQLMAIGNYVFEKTLGEGNFAKVKLAKHLITGQEVAIKVIDKTQLEEKKLSKLYREVKVMKMLHHPGIVRLYEVIETRYTLFLIMEYMPGGELYDYLVAHGKMKEKDARAKFRQILAAVSYCHKKHIIHRDLKAENLLLDSNLDVKIADFGFCNSFDPEGKLDTFCGSPPYAAPELFQGRRYVGPDVDVWSLGVILYVMTTGALPFEGRNLPEMREAVCHGQYRIPFHLSENCENLIRKMLVRDPKKRHSLEILSNDPWIMEGHTTSPIEVDISTQITEDEQLINMIALKFNLERDTIIKSLRENLYDEISALYYLMYHERDRTGDYSRVTQVLNSAIPGTPLGMRGQGTSAQPDALAVRTDGIANNPAHPSALSAPAAEHNRSSTTPAAVPQSAEGHVDRTQAAALPGQSHHHHHHHHHHHKAIASTTARTHATTDPGTNVLQRPPVVSGTVPRQPSAAANAQVGGKPGESAVDSNSARRRRFTIGEASRTLREDKAAATAAAYAAAAAKAEAAANASAPGQSSRTTSLDASAKPNETSVAKKHHSAIESSSGKGDIAEKPESNTSMEKGAPVAAAVSTSTTTSGVPSPTGGKTEGTGHCSVEIPANAAQADQNDQATAPRKRNNTIVGYLKTIRRGRDESDEQGHHGDDKASGKLKAAADSASTSSSTAAANASDSIKQGKTEDTKPRSLRFTFNSNSTSTLPPDEIVRRVVEACNRLRVQNKLASRFLLNCVYTPASQHEPVRFEVEICKLPRLNDLHGLKFKRITGNASDYKSICECFLGCVKLN